MDWHQAQDYCWSELEYVAHLVEIYDYDQNDYLAQKLNEYEDTSRWREWGIGLVNLGGKSNPRWIWSYSLQPSNFTKFYSLDDGTTFKDAVVMSNLFHDYDYEYQDYYWTYVSLSHQFYPICQYKPSQPNSTTTTTPITTVTPTPTTSPTTATESNTSTTTEWWEITTTRQTRSTTDPWWVTTTTTIDCALNPCQNGGTCVVDWNWPNGKCHCSPGFNGTHCEEETFITIDKCAMKERRFDFWSFFGGMFLVTTVVVLVAIIGAIVYHFSNNMNNNQFEEKILR